MKLNRREFGFTLVELLMVIVVIAVIATLATGAAMRSVKQSRKKRVEITRSVLQSALANYRARENHWPWTALPEKMSGGDPNLRYFKGRDNADVFGELIRKTVDDGVPYLDLSGLQTDKIAAKAKSRSLRDYIAEHGASGDLALGYVDPDNPSKFRYFKVEYNITTDSVSVLEE